MHGFETHRHFQRAGEQIAKAQGFLPHEARMRFDHDMLREPNRAGDGRVFRRRNRGGVKEAAAVVQFQLFRARTELPQRVFDLPRDGAGRDSLRRRVLPQIAHQAAPGAFLVGQQNDTRTLDASGIGAFLFEAETVRPERIHAFTFRPLTRDPGGQIARGRRHGQIPLNFFRHWGRGVTDCRH